MNHTHQLIRLYLLRTCIISLSVIQSFALSSSSSLSSSCRHRRRHGISNHPLSPRTFTDPNTINGFHTHGMIQNRVYDYPKWQNPRPYEWILASSSSSSSSSRSKLTTFTSSSMTLHIHPPIRSFQQQHSTKISSQLLQDDSKEDSTFLFLLNRRRRIIHVWVSQMKKKLFVSKTHYHSLIQLTLLLLFYIFHLTVLTQHSILFPFQLIPNDKGHFQSIGYDSFVGIIVFLSYLIYYGKKNKNHHPQEEEVRNNIYNTETDESLLLSSSSKSPWSSVSYQSTQSPFTFPSPPIYQNLKKEDKNNDDDVDENGIHNNNNSNSTQVVASTTTTTSSTSSFSFTTINNFVSLHQITKLSSIFTFFLLVFVYFMTGRIASLIELSLYSFAEIGFPLSIPMHRSLVVLGGHLTWVLAGSLLLSLLVQPQPFFPTLSSSISSSTSSTTEKYNDKSNKKKRNNTFDESTLNNNTTTTSSSNINTSSSKISSIYKWYTCNFWNTNWLWWTIGGYVVSSWFFNIADGINQYVLPKQVFELASEGVVAQLINPENNDIWASIVGYIAPCITAPWWEEVLYRGFLLPTLCLFMNFWVAVVMSGILFSIHHLSTTGAIPLAILGITWATLYAKSGNLMVTILIHACWNSRVFLGSWFGL